VVGLGERLTPGDPYGDALGKVPCNRIGHGRVTGAGSGPLPP